MQVPTSDSPYSEAISGCIGPEIDSRSFGSWLKPGQDIGANWQRAIDQTPAGSIITFPQGIYQFSDGATTRKRLGIKGAGRATEFQFVPSVARDTFLHADGVNAASAEQNEELQLSYVWLEDFILTSNRSIRCNGLNLRHVDNLHMKNVFTDGIMGSSIQCRNTREWRMFNVTTRFGGCLDKENPHLSDPDWVWKGIPYFEATLLQSVTASGSVQTVSVSVTSNTDASGVIVGLSTGAGVVIGPKTANAETVYLTSVGAGTITGVFAQNHSSGDKVFIGRDNTNWARSFGVNIIYPFWHGLYLEEVSRLTTIGIMVHMIPAGDTTNGANLEGNIVKRFGGQKGFASGVARNVYAELHKPVTGNEATVSGLGFDPASFMWAAGVWAYKAPETRISCGDILGGATNYVVVAEDNGTAANANPDEPLGRTSISLSMVGVGAANASTAHITPFSQVGQEVSVNTSTGIVTTGGMVVPPTGYPVMFRHATNDANLPAGLQGYQIPMYCIRVSDTTMKVATTKEKALASESVAITSLGTGVTYLQLMTGCPISAWGGAHVYLDPSVYLDNGLMPFSRDSFPLTPYGTSVHGVPTIGSAFAQQQVISLSQTTGNTNATFAGTSFGLDGEKLGFFGSLPVTKPAAASQAAATDAATTMTLANSIRAALVATGIIKGSA